MCSKLRFLLILGAAAMLVPAAACNSGGGGNAFCGDGVREDAEECDLTDVGGETCETLGLGAGGALSCNMNCTFNTLQCPGACGDGEIQPLSEDCDCGTDPANLPANGGPNGTACTDVNGGPAATCDLTCAKVPVCGDNIRDAGEQCDDGNTDPGDGCDAQCQDEVVCGELFEDCDILSINACCTDDWGVDLLCSDPFGSGASCWRPCQGTQDCYWDQFCETQATPPFCRTQICGGLGWPDTLEDFCTVTGSGQGYCAPIFRFVDATTDEYIGICFEIGGIPEGGQCQLAGGNDRSNDTCDTGACFGQTGEQFGTCARFCKWRQSYDAVVYLSGQAQDLPCGAASTGCVSNSILDQNENFRRSEDFSYCERSDLNDITSCSLITGQILTEANMPPPDGTGDGSLTCADVMTDGRCIGAFADPSQSGALIGACSDQLPVSTLNALDTCASTDECPEGHICTGEDIFTNPNPATTVCLPLCDVDFHGDTGGIAGAPQNCEGLGAGLAPGTLDATSYGCRTLSDVWNPGDAFPTPLGVCALR